MVEITVDFPKEMDREIDLYKLKNECKNERGNLDKRAAIIQIVEEHLFRCLTRSGGKK